ncbi:hypothetical protein ASPTUDRAFT_455018 [Aspergillus tubingensis CBS 134.48]|uniref:Transmembrane protein n=1 Tax=Aspergillus tubingensis (strain CBS 134.48) TaxID=767770 RepID=A0A1L9NAS3_ASPTC|nr:hypothetical protein ASPTUDRAFT_455018 [Aspergillus tubingensis CBS 134.48]
MRGIRSRQVVPKRTLPNQSTMEKGLSACRYKGGKGTRSSFSAGAVRISGVMRSTRSCMKFRARSSPCRMVATFLFLLFFYCFSRWIHHIYFVLRLRWRGFVRRTINDCDFDSGSSVAGLERGWRQHNPDVMLSSVTP